MSNAYYNPSDNIQPHTRADATQVSNELLKIQQAFAKLPAPSAISATGGQANYTHTAYSDSADGTANFTTGEPGARSYIGFFANQPTATPSENPSDYTWTRLRGADGTDGTDGTDGSNGADGQNGTDGRYRDFRFTRSIAEPAPAVLSEPAGTYDYIPSGTEPVWVTSVVRNGDGTLASAWEPWIRLSALPSAAPYDAATTYYEGMQVTFNGGTYILIVPTSTGTAPSGTAQANATWDVVSAPGQPGEPATPASAFSATIDLTSSSTGANLRTLADTAGYTGQSDATITFRVPNGVTITGSSSGGKAIDTGSWPDSSYTIALTFVVQSGGVVYGGGGGGGTGGSGGANLPGAPGGDAIFCRTPLAGVTVDSGGVLAGGGGGGGGGISTTGQTSGFEPEIGWGGGGGGGGGAPNGLAGNGGRNDLNVQAGSGNAGTVVAGGSGGAKVNGRAGSAGDGAAGGALATAGANNASTSASGAAGYALRRNGHAAPLTNNGSVSGSVG